MSLGVLLLPVLSLDTLLVAFAVARSGPARRTLALLVLAEVLAPLVGYAIGAAVLWRFAPVLAHLAAGAVLLLLGAWLLHGAGEAAEEAIDSLEKAPLLGMAAVGFDEFGFGLALPALGTSPWLTVGYLALQAPAAAILGLWLGRRWQFGGFLGYLPAVLVGLLGIAQIVQTIR